MLQPYERLKRVFDGHIERVVRRFGISFDLARKWMRDTDDMGTGRANPLQRTRDLIDEAFIVDPSGEGARLIAQDSIEYYEALMSRQVKPLNQHQEVNTLLEKTVALASQLNIQDIRGMSATEQKELSEKISETLCAGERIRAFLNAAMKGGTNARQFIAPRRERVGSGD